MDYSPNGLEFLLPDVQLLLHLQPVALVFVADPDETLLLFLAGLGKSRGGSELTTGTLFRSINTKEKVS